MPERRDSPEPSDRLSAFGQRLTGFVAPAPVDAGPGLVDFRYGDPRELPELRAALLAALMATLGDAVTIVGADAGLHVAVWLNGVARDREAALIARAREAGLGVHPVTPSYASGPSMDRPEVAGLVMGYAGLDELDIKRGVRMLQGVLGAFTNCET